MLFNSYPFIFVFLPIVLVGFFALSEVNDRAPIAWLAAASLAFYAAGSWEFLPLLLCSGLFNFAIGWILIRQQTSTAPKCAVLAFGVGIDLLVLGYFKYAGFITANLNSMLSTAFVSDVALPIGISFYTFTQIAFLVDAYRGHVSHYGLPRYLLFVTYFPHLIAGPIIHHKDVIPQFEKPENRLPNPHLIYFGLVIFAMGLFKKTILADGIQPFVALAFGPDTPSFYQAWIGALAYAFQLYFDFSGYSDMAVGLSLMFGVFLPVNFNAPYKAISIIDFWRRWHMTLSQFLRDYLYIPLGGNRRGTTLRYANLMLTMTLGGLWHGAAWTFVAWGALHGVYLCINHAWNHFGPKTPLRFAGGAKLLYLVLTFTSVVVSWIFFRADSLTSALTILSKMARPTHVALTYREMFAAALLCVYASIIWLAPTTQQIVGYDHSNRHVGQNLAENRNWPTLLAAAVLALAVLGIQQHSEFIYFRF